MKKVTIVFLVVVFLILFVIFGINLSRGELLNHQVLNLLEYSNMDQVKATCLDHHGQVISNEELYSELLVDCELTAAYGYDSDYFEEKVIIINIYQGTTSRRPLKFYDYFFRHSSNEIITVKYENHLFPRKDDVNNMYFIEIGRKDISSSNILFD